MECGVQSGHDSQIALYMQLGGKNKSHSASFLFVIHVFLCKLFQIGITTATPLLKCTEKC